MSERADSAAEQDPHFDEAAANIAASLERIMKRYQDFVAGEGELQLAVYKQDQAGIYEPSAHHRLHLSRELDLTDNPDTAETINYHVWISNDGTDTTSVDVDLRVTLEAGSAKAMVRKGSIHMIDNALHNFVEVKGL